MARIRNPFRNFLKQTWVLVPVIIQELVWLVGCQAAKEYPSEFVFDSSSLIDSISTAENVSEPCRSHILAYMEARGILRGKPWARKSKRTFRIGEFLFYFFSF